MRMRGLWKLPNGKDWLWGKLGLALVGGAMLIKSLIQFSVDGQGSVPSLLFDLRPNYGGSNEDNGDLLQKVPCMHFYTQCPNPAVGHSMKLGAMSCRATQDGQVTMESSDKTWSTAGGNGNPLPYSCLENPMNTMKRQKDRTL